MLHGISISLALCVSLEYAIMIYADYYMIATFNEAVAYDNAHPHEGQQLYGIGGVFILMLSIFIIINIICAIVTFVIGIATKKRPLHLVFRYTLAASALSPLLTIGFALVSMKLPMGIIALMEVIFFTAPYAISSYLCCRPET